MSTVSRFCLPLVRQACATCPPRRDLAAAAGGAGRCRPPAEDAPRRGRLPRHVGRRACASSVARCLRRESRSAQRPRLSSTSAPAAKRWSSGRRTREPALGAYCSRIPTRLFRGPCTVGPGRPAGPAVGAVDGRPVLDGRRDGAGGVFARTAAPGRLAVRARPRIHADHRTDLCEHLPFPAHPARGFEGTRWSLGADVLLRDEAGCAPVRARTEEALETVRALLPGGWLKG